LERDHLRADDLIEESQHIESDYDPRSKAEEEKQLRAQAEQEVARLDSVRSVSMPMQKKELHS